MDELTLITLCEQILDVLILHLGMETLTQKCGIGKQFVVKRCFHRFDQLILKEIVENWSCRVFEVLRTLVWCIETWTFLSTVLKTSPKIIASLIRLSLILQHKVVDGCGHFSISKI